MKLIQLSHTTEKHKGQDITMSTIDLIKVATNNTPDSGVLVADIMNRLRIIAEVDKLSPDAVELQLEDSDFANLGSYVKATKWAIVSNFIVEFAKQFS